MGKHDGSAAAESEPAPAETTETSTQQSGGRVLPQPDGHHSPLTDPESTA